MSTTLTACITIMQFGGSKFEMYQTLGANDPNKLIISSANKTGDILWDKHGFLYKMTNNKIKAVFKIGSDAVSLTSTQYTSGKIKYLKLEIFLPLTKEFKKLNFTTFGLLGSHDDDFNNDFKYRNGTSHNRQFHGFNDCKLLNCTNYRYLVYRMCKGYSVE